MGHTSYIYDPDGNILSKTDANNNTINYVYDSLNRNIIINYPNGDNDKFFYDDASKWPDNNTWITGFSTDRLTRAISYRGDFGGNTFDHRACYDERGNVTTEQRIIEGGTGNAVYTYNALGMKLTENITTDSNPIGEKITYAYDAAGRDLSVVGNQKYVSKILYTPYGKINSIANGNNVTLNYQYYDNGESSGTIASANMKNYMLSRIYASSTAIKMDKSYLYDYNGNVLAITDNITPSYKQTFTYDPFQITGTHDYLDRLHIATSVMYGTKTYEYDAIGNITLKDGLGYYYAQCPHQVIADDNHDYSYDSNGNMAVKYDYSVDPNIEWDYSYDYNNMLTSASQNGGFEMSNEYDPTGARIYKEEYSDAYGWEYTTYFFPNYEEVSKEAEYDCTRYISANGKRLAENRTINDYSTGATTSTVYYYYNDHLGSSSRISSMQGKTLTLSKLYEYDPYGKTAVENPAYGTGLDERFKFNGKEQDASTGLYYYGARYYSQELGKYITPDSATPGQRF